MHYLLIGLLLYCSKLCQFSPRFETLEFKSGKYYKDMVNFIVHNITKFHAICKMTKTVRPHSGS